MILSPADAFPDPTLPAERRRVLENALLNYCERDTLAMVRLAEFFADTGSRTAADTRS